MELNKIYQGNAFEVLKTFEDNAIDCCITSPPYWGLRNYGNDVQVYGGSLNCNHNWEEQELKLHYGESSKQPEDKKLNKPMNPMQKDHQKIKSDCCQKCGAWKGNLGLEPTPQEYINHIVNISCKVMRVLKPTGNYFLNVGDSFASHRSGSDMEINISKEERLNSLIKRNSPKKEVKSNWFQEKQKLLIPHRIAIALQEKGFILRQDIVWVKKLFKYPEKESIGSCMPMPVKDRFNTAQEYIFHFVKSKKYYYDLSEVKSPIKNSSLTRAESPPSYSFRNESEINPFKSQEKGFNKLYEKIKNNYIDDDNSGRRTIMEANPTNCIMFKRENQITTKEVEHFAKFPKSLVEMLLLCGCPEQGVCLDPFIGSGTTIEVCLKNNRKFIGIELNPDFVKITEERIKPLMEQMKLI